MLRQRPNEFDALHMLGLIEYQRGRLPESLKLIGAAVKSKAIQRGTAIVQHVGMVRLDRERPTASRTRLRATRRRSASRLITRI
ncbi:MAG: hypothetical protein WBE48_19610, partial [Xanthobacteraceae bacterium]